MGRKPKATPTGFSTFRLSKPTNTEGPIPSNPSQSQPTSTQSTPSSGSTQGLPAEGSASSKTKPRKTYYSLDTNEKRALLVDLCIEMKVYKSRKFKQTTMRAVAESYNNIMGLKEGEGLTISTATKCMTNMIEEGRASLKTRLLASGKEQVPLTNLPDADSIINFIQLLETQAESSDIQSRQKQVIRTSEMFRRSLFNKHLQEGVTTNGEAFGQTQNQLLENARADIECEIGHHTNVKTALEKDVDKKRALKEKERLRSKRRREAAKETNMEKLRLSNECTEKIYQLVQKKTQELSELPTVLEEVVSSVKEIVTQEMKPLWDRLMKVESCLYDLQGESTAESSFSSAYGEDQRTDL